MSSTLYYSDQCPHCLKLLKSPNISKVDLVNIEHNRLPSSVTSVPTIIDTNNKIHIGKNAFVFLTTMEDREVKPYEFNLRNNTNTGFSFIDSTEHLYCENNNYTEIN